MAQQPQKKDDVREKQMEIDELLQSNSSNGQEQGKGAEEDEQFDRQIDKISLQKLIQSESDLFEEIKQINSNAVRKINSGQQKQALSVLQNAEQILQFAASCGQSIDRNMIVVVLYNQACIYQGMWVLEQCSKYLDGVIYNIQLGLKQSQKKENLDSQGVEIDSTTFRVQKQIFLVQTYLQYCAILSQLGLHQNALENAQQATDTLHRVLQTCYSFCHDKLKDTDRPISTSSSTHSSSKLGKLSKNNSQQTTAHTETSNESQSKIIKEDVSFMRIVCENSFKTLSELNMLKPIEQLGNQEQQEHLSEAQQHLYFWKINPENNEKHIRKQLNLNQNGDQEESRSILGVMNGNEWIENFNIGSIMHMTPITYQEFALFGDLFFEISKKELLEKIIFLSICYFTIATEIRFIELDQNKEKQKGDHNQLNSEEFKKSQIFHLQAIETACQYVTCQCPYINHLITSYHKHYNQNLETINEQSFISVISEQHSRMISKKEKNSAIQEKHQAPVLQPKQAQTSVSQQPTNILEGLNLPQNSSTQNQQQSAAPSINSTPSNIESKQNNPILGPQTQKPMGEKFETVKAEQEIFETKLRSSQTLRQSSENDFYDDIKYENNQQLVRGAPERDQNLGNSKPSNQQYNQNNYNSPNSNNLNLNNNNYNNMNSNEMSSSSSQFYQQNYPSNSGGPPQSKKNPTSSAKNQPSSNNVPGGNITVGSNFYKEFQSFLNERQSSPVLYSDDNLQSLASNYIKSKTAYTNQNGINNNNINNNNNNNNMNPNTYSSSINNNGSNQPSAYQKAHSSIQSQIPISNNFNSNGFQEQTTYSGTVSARTSSSQLLTMSPKEKNFNMTNYQTLQPSNTNELTNGINRRPPAKSIGNQSNSQGLNQSWKIPQQLDLQPVSPNNYNRTLSNNQNVCQTDRPTSDIDFQNYNKFNHQERSKLSHNIGEATNRQDNQLLMDLYQRIEKNSINKPMMQNFLKMDQKGNINRIEENPSYSVDPLNYQSRLSTDAGLINTPKSKQFENFLQNVSKTQKETAIPMKKSEPIRDNQMNFNNMNINTPSGSVVKANFKKENDLMTHMMTMENLGNTNSNNNNLVNQYSPRSNSNKNTAQKKENNPKYY